MMQLLPRRVAGEQERDGASWRDEATCQVPAGSRHNTVW